MERLGTGGTEEYTDVEEKWKYRSHLSAHSAISAMIFNLEPKQHDISQLYWNTNSSWCPQSSIPANMPAEVPHSTGLTSNTTQPTPQTSPGIDSALYCSFPGKYPTDIRGFCQSSEI